jgi:hypothetical protein
MIVSWDDAGWYGGNALIYAIAGVKGTIVRAGITSPGLDMDSNLGRLGCPTELRQ